MTMKYSKRTINIFIPLLIVSPIITSIAQAKNPLCIETEKQALLTFKQSLKDPISHLLSSWNDSSRDCCAWEYVGCDNLTGHVREIHLQNSGLGGIIDPSLLDLRHLAYLDLSGNEFHGSEIPSFIGSLVSLKYLNLSYSGFRGTIPPNLGNLSSLRTLDLNALSVETDGIQWLSGLVQLEYLNLNNVNLTRVSNNWLEEVNELPNLIEIHLSGCSLDRIAPDLDRRLNFSSLKVLDLSFNSFDSLFPSWVFNCTNLVYLDLSSNYFKGPIHSGNNMDELRFLDLSGTMLNTTLPHWLFDSYNIEYLDLSLNFMHGGIPDAIENMSSLSFLDLRFNKFSGKISWKAWNICNLQEVYLSSNMFEGDSSDIFGSRMSECFLASLLHLDVKSNRLSGELSERLGEFERIQYLDLCENSLTGSIPFGLGHLSSLKTLVLRDNKLVGNIPSSFGQLLNLEKLDLDNNMLEGIVTENHFSNLSKLSYLSATRNSLTLRVREDWTPPFQLIYINLNSWKVISQFPSWLQTQRNLMTIELYNTGISGEIPPWFWSLPSLRFLNISHNQLHGEIPRMISQEYVCLNSNNLSGPLPLLNSNMTVLDLSNNSFSGGISRTFCSNTEDPNSLIFLLLERNNLSGEIPDCWINWPSLSLINLGNNNFHGKIPSSFGLLGDSLVSLNLYNNALSGRIPSSLQNCTSLKKTDLSGNKLEGNVPAWIGTSLSKLEILILRSNKFSGEIDPEICKLTFLHILDLASNAFSGAVPSCLSNSTIMSSQNNQLNYNGYVYYMNYLTGVFLESASLTTKGSILQYDSMISLFSIIDLSNNQFSGNVPNDLTSLAGLRSLNLSGNYLSGSIPDNIGGMTSLESLDFSRNNLSGEIPTGLSRLTYLNYLNLSCNGLSGRIPLSTQLQSFNSSSFFGNRLCGLPLSNKCKGDYENTIPSNSRNNKETSHHEDSEVDIDMWFYVCMSLGFIVGFWIWWVALIFKNSWRYAFIKFLDDIWDKVC